MLAMKDYSYVQSNLLEAYLICLDEIKKNPKSFVKRTKEIKTHLRDLLIDFAAIIIIIHKCKKATREEAFFLSYKKLMKITTNRRWIYIKERLECLHKVPENMMTVKFDIYTHNPEFGGKLLETKTCKFRFNRKTYDRIMKYPKGRLRRDDKYVIETLIQVSKLTDQYCSRYTLDKPEIDDLYFKVGHHFNKINWMTVMNKVNTYFIGENK